MESAWKRWLELAVLWGSPVVIIAVVLALGWWLQTVRSNFGAMRSTMGITVLAGLGVLALHSGYFVAPFVEGRGPAGEIWAVVLMAPGVLAALGVVILLGATGVGADLAGKIGGGAGVGVAAVVGLAVYLGPAWVLLAD